MERLSGVAQLIVRPIKGRSRGASVELWGKRRRSEVMMQWYRAASTGGGGQRYETNGRRPKHAGIDPVRTVACVVRVCGVNSERPCRTPCARASQTHRRCQGGTVDRNTRDTEGWRRRVDRIRSAGSWKPFPHILARLQSSSATFFALRRLDTAARPHALISVGEKVRHASACSALLSSAGVSQDPSGRAPPIKCGGGAGTKSKSAHLLRQQPCSDAHAIVGVVGTR